MEKRRSQTERDQEDLSVSEADRKKRVSERETQAAAALREVVGNPEDCCIRNGKFRSWEKELTASDTLMRAEG